MIDLFGNENTKKQYRRDSVGRFANERTAQYEKALTEAKKYKLMYERERSRMIGMSKIIRQKDELINKLKYG